MTKTSLVIFMIAIMVVGVLGTSLTPNAEALKGKGVGVSQYGSSTDICGLVLCSEYPGGKAAYQEMWTSSFIDKSIVSNVSQQNKHETNHVSVFAYNVDEEYPAQLDVSIHKFELDKISAEEAIMEIKEVHDAYVNERITNDIVNGVGDKLNLYNEGIFDAATAVEAIHLTAEPQNVDPEFILAIEEYTYRYELNEISLSELIDGVTDVYDGMIELTITSDLIEDIGVQLAVYDSGRVSPEFTAEEIAEIIEKAELAAAKVMSDTGIPVMKELPPNTVDIPAGTGVPGCEVDDWCYMPSNLIVSVGTTVTWINSDTLPHTVTSGNADADAVGLDIPNGFDSGFMSIDDRFEHTFDVVGLYDYYCQLHPWMQGSITIE